MFYIIPCSTSMNLDPFHATGIQHASKLLQHVKNMEKSLKHQAIGLNHDKNQKINLPGYLLYGADYSHLKINVSDYGQ